MPAAVRWAREEAGGPGTTVVYAWLSLDDDRPAAAAALRPGLEGWIERACTRRCASTPGSRTRLSTTSRTTGCARSRWRATRATAHGRSRELWGAGADSVVLVPRHEDRADQVARFAAEVRPLL